jgi:GDPmannose 4,6-dehydratase
LAQTLKVLITGAGGQDGIILASKLQRVGTDLVGLCSEANIDKVKRILPTTKFVEFNTREPRNIQEILNQEQPDQIYNLVGFSSVFASWESPAKTAELNAVIPSLILEWCRSQPKPVRFLQASSSEIFGGTAQSPQKEDSALCPITPYGISKAYAHQLVGLFRESIGMHASTAILYNHESPLRSQDFITRKISSSVARISLGLQRKIFLGDIQGKRDWGWAPDYVDGMIDIMNGETPGDFIISTGIQTSVESLLAMAFAEVGISDFRPYVQVSGFNQRAIDPKNLVGDFTKINKAYGWAPKHGIHFGISAMVMNDIALLKRDVSETDLSWIYK